VEDSLKRRLLLIKSRGSKHSNQYHDFLITDHGIELSEDSPARLHEAKK